MAVHRPRFISGPPMPRRSQGHPWRRQFPSQHLPQISQRLGSLLCIAGVVLAAMVLVYIQWQNTPKNFRAQMHGVLTNAGGTCVLPADLSFNGSLSARGDQFNGLLTINGKTFPGTLLSTGRLWTAYPGDTRAVIGDRVSLVNGLRSFCAEIPSGSPLQQLFPADHPAETLYLCAPATTNNDALSLIRHLLPIPPGP